MRTETGRGPTQTPKSSGGSTIRLTVTGLVVLCGSLVAITTLATHYVGNRQNSSGQEVVQAGGGNAGATTSPTGPWGDLMTLDVEIQQPEEYVSFEATTNRKTAWVFPASSVNQVKSMLAGGGLTETQIEEVLAPDKVESVGGTVTVKPTAEIVLSLTPEVRAKLYSVLAKWPENKYMQQPYHLPGAFEVMCAKSGLPPEVIGLIKKLTYHRAGIDFFSDPELALEKITSENDRLLLLKTLTYQTAVLARLHLRPDSDIDKIVGYWGAVPGVRAKDLRPLLESITRTPEGGTISLLYLLPQFARERLFTSPLPTQAGDTRMDCHWTALNFFNSTPDDRLQDNAFASTYIKENFYQIGKPSMCGDLMFVLDDKGAVIHSAVYIADDIVFTKNGLNYAQPWILMRTKNLLDVYTLTEAPKVLYYRRKEA